MSDQVRPENSETMFARSAATIALDGFDITPSDADELTIWARSIYVGGFGNIKVKTIRGNTLTFNNVQDGQILPVAVRQVFDTDTTATNLIGLLG